MDIDKINNLIDTINRIIEHQGFECIDVEYSHKDKTIRVYINSLDASHIVNIDDCVNITKILSNNVELDKLTLNKDYFLEVSSPGLERPIRKKQDFIKYIGKTVEFKVDNNLFKSKKFKGVVIGVDKDDKLKVQTSKGIVDVSLRVIERANLIYDKFNIL